MKATKRSVVAVTRRELRRVRIRVVVVAAAAVAVVAAVVAEAEAGAGDHTPPHRRTTTREAQARRRHPRGAAQGPTAAPLSSSGSSSAGNADLELDSPQHPRQGWPESIQPGRALDGCAPALWRRLGALVYRVSRFLHELCCVCERDSACGLTTPPTCEQKGNGHRGHTCDAFSCPEDGPVWGE